ncbi:MAG: hypothetical protein ACRD1R_18680, partial [Acidobacteriota bacterium]
QCGRMAASALLIGEELKSPLPLATADIRLARATLAERVELVWLRPLYLDFVEDAIILYDRQGFFAQVLARLKR